MGKSGIMVEYNKPGRVRVDIDCEIYLYPTELQRIPVTHRNIFATLMDKNGMAFDYHTDKLARVWYTNALIVNIGVSGVPVIIDNSPWTLRLETESHLPFRLIESWTEDTEQTIIMNGKIEPTDSINIAKHHSMPADVVIKATPRQLTHRYCFIGKFEDAVKLLAASAEKCGEQICERMVWG